MRNQNATRTADELRKDADNCRVRRQESFERCDTDGFMSQAALDIMAQVYEHQANIVENGGKWTFYGLYEGNRRVPARHVEGQFGTSWCLADDADVAKFGRRFIPIGAKSRVQRELGLREAQEEDLAKAESGGWYSVWTTRLGDWNGRDAVLLEEEKI